MHLVMVYDHIYPWYLWKQGHPFAESLHNLHDLTSTDSRFNSIKFTLNQTLVQHTNVVIYPIDSAYVLGHFYKRGLIYS